MNTKWISRREFLRLATIASGAAALSACAPAATPTSAPQATEAVKPAEAIKAPAAAEPTKTAEPTAAKATPPPAQSVKLKVNAYLPSEWDARSAEHPFVTNAPRILAEKYKEVAPNVEIEWVRFQAPEGQAGDSGYNGWLTALTAAGNEPDIVDPLHEIPIQNGLCLPIDDFLMLPNPYADNKVWKDIFYPSLMKSLVFGDGKTYCAPISHPYPGVEVGMAYNKTWLDKIGMKPPTTWSEELQVCKALKEGGSGLSPWPPEAKEGNVWPVALQLLISMLQDPECPKMDTNGDFFVGAEEALPAFRDDLIAQTSPKYKAAWLEMKKLAGYWVDGWATADLETMWRDGQIGLRTTGAWEFSAQKNDPLIKFERGMFPMPFVTSKDVPGGNDPIEFTPGDGKVPADLVTAINGPDSAIMKVSKDRGTTDAAVKWLMWITEPKNNAFLVNENENRIPAAKDAKLGPLFSEVATFKVPKWKYQIAWWGEGLYWDNTHFNELRKIFVAWMTGQMDDSTFFARQQAEGVSGAKRYGDSIKK